LELVAARRVLGLILSFQLLHQMVAAVAAAALVKTVALAAVVILAPQGVLESPGKEIMEVLVVVVAAAAAAQALLVRTEPRVHAAMAAMGSSRVFQEVLFIMPVAAAGALINHLQRELVA
jgi:hypothetical protein